MKELVNLLSEGGLSLGDAERAAEIVVSDGWRKVPVGVWKRDGDCQSLTKDVFICSVCGRWQSAKKRSDKMFYMKFCPHCGAEMDVEMQNAELR